MTMCMWLKAQLPFESRFFIPRAVKIRKTGLSRSIIGMSRYQDIIILSALPDGKWCSPIVKFRTKLISYGITNVRDFFLHRLSLDAGGPPLWTQNPFLSISSAVSQPGIWVQWSNAPSALGPKQRFLLSRSGLSWGLQPWKMVFVINGILFQKLVDWLWEKIGM